MDAELRSRQGAQAQQVVMRWVCEVLVGTTNPSKGCQHGLHLWSVQDFLVPLLRSYTPGISLTSHQLVHERQDADHDQHLREAIVEADAAIFHKTGRV